MRRFRATERAAYLLLAALLWLTSTRVAWAQEAQGAAARPVGELGRWDAITFEGVTSFTRDQMRAGLASYFDFHLAAHPAAPLDDFVSALERMVRSGYARAGFPEAKVSVSPDPNGHRLLVRVTEGPRCQCGEIQVTGLRNLSAELVRTNLARALLGEPARDREDWTAPRNVWNTNRPAPLDESARDFFKQQVVKVLAELDCFQPEVEVKVVPDAARKLARLSVEVKSEGPRGVVAEIQVIGLRKNTREQVLQHLDLAPGMELHGSLVEGVSNRLWKSARFIKQQVTLRPLAEAGRFELVLNLAELAEAPPWDEEFGPETQALLKFRDWLMEWGSRPENLVLNLESRVGGEALNADWLFSPTALAVVARRAPADQRQPVRYAVLASARELGLYSPERGLKAIVSPLPARLSAFLSMLPREDAEKSGKFNITIGAGFQSGEGGSPFRITLSLMPAAFVHWDDLAAGRVLEQGVLTVTNKSDKPDGTRFELKIEAATGRLLSALVSGGSGKASYRLRLRTEAGALERAFREVTTLTTNHPNVFTATNPISSVLGFVARDLLESPFVARLLWTDQPAARVDHLRAAAKKVEVAQLLQPLDRLWTGMSRFPAGDKGTGQFLVPLDDSIRVPDPVAGVLRGFGTTLLRECDTLWPPGSWPATLVREALLGLAGQGRYAAVELDRLSHSPEVGPLGSLTGTMLFAALNPDAVGALPMRGMSRLTCPELEKDWRLLLQPDSVSGQVLGKALVALGALSDEDLNELAASLVPGQAALLRDCARAARSAPPAAVAGALEPVIERHWDADIRPGLQAAFGRGLADLGRAYQKQRKLPEAQAAYEDAVAIQRKLPAQGLALAGALEGFAAVLEAQDYSIRAEGLLREALALRKERQGSECFEVAESLQKLGGVLAQRQKWAEAEGTYREALAILRKVHNEKCSHLAAVLDGLGTALLNGDRSGQAEPVLREALALHRTLHENDRRQLLPALARLAVTLVRSDRLAEAEPLLREGLALQQESASDDRAVGWWKEALAQIEKAKRADTGRPRAPR